MRVFVSILDSSTFPIKRVAEFWEGTYLTHTLLDAALSDAGLNRTTALVTPALLVAVNLTDIDIFGSLIGQKSLDFHRGITHSLAGV